MTVGRAERIARQRVGDNTVAQLRAQLVAADQRLIAAAAELRAERREREEWQRVAQVRAERIVTLEQAAHV
ncbi:hypothetical protein [Arenimonas sp.]|uniref:hypothetical protein n=1 Tax=Arenimonas sp. TaxID=1872635 RepID=UPI0025BF76C4|nr:hypothetical protein [Arenimonas sp.]